MDEKKFNPKKLAKLNNPQRLVDIPVKEILDAMALQDSDVLVEIGAGTGFFSIEFLKQTKANCLFASDISEIMLEWMTENVVPSYPAIKPIQNVESSLPLDDEIADLVFTVSLHHELEAPEEVFKEAYRVLKPGGKILVIDWKKEEMSEGPPLQIRCEAEDVCKQMKSAGFTHCETNNSLMKYFVVFGEK